MIALLTALALIAATPAPRADMLKIPPSGLGGPAPGPQLEEPQPVTPSSLERSGGEPTIILQPAPKPAQW
jgi:hypothetical protein